nr:hypothetical protein CISIN_1g010132mg [Ipomoea batatas]
MKRLFLDNMTAIGMIPLFLTTQTLQLLQPWFCAYTMNDGKVCPLYLRQEKHLIQEKQKFGSSLRMSLVIYSNVKSVGGMNLSYVSNHQKQCI